MPSSLMLKIQCEEDDPTRTRTHLKGGGILTHSGHVIKVGKTLRGALTLLTNANGGKSSRTTNKDVRFESQK